MSTNESVPEPERSKEETVEVKASSLLAIRDALAADNLNEAWHELYTIADPDFCEMEPWRNLEHKAALETPPLHKKGEDELVISEAPKRVIGTIAHIDHGKTSLTAAVTRIITAESAAPAPVPVTITNRMVNIAWAEFNAKSHATHLDAMRAALAAALSAKPGEQG